MRKIIVLMLFAAGTSTALFAQDFKDVKEKLDKGKYDEAREKIDTALADPKNQKSANAWYYKGVIYGELAKDSSKTDMDYRMESFNALKKYQELDSKNIMLLLNQNAHFFQLYEGYYNQGAKDFNDKAYDKAFAAFVNALQIKDYAYGRGYEINGFKFAALDTQLVNLAGRAGMLAKMEDSAAPYFAMIADSKIAGEDYKDVYPILVDYYTRKGDSVNSARYLAVGMELYPGNPYWNQTKLSAAGNDRAKRLEQFEEMIKADPKNADLLVDYGVELFSFLYGKDRPTDYAGTQAKLATALKDAIAQNPSSAYANFIMTQHLSNQIYDMEQDYNAMKGTKPDDVKKKTTLNKEIQEKLEEMFTYSLATYNLFDKMDELKGTDKANFRTVTNQLIDYYRIKKQPEKAKVYEQKLTTLK